jgi:folate-binding protein YgfZ
MTNGAPSYTRLDDRALLRLSGPDAKEFLQGLISNDVGKLNPGHALYAAFLTAQGKYLHDFFLIDRGDHLLLDGEAARLADLKRRLGIYKLRSKVAIEDADAALKVFALPGEQALGRLQLPSETGAAAPLGDGVAYVDPRLTAMGARAVLSAETAAKTLGDAGFEPGNRDAYDRVRLHLGLADGSRDLEVDKSVLLEYGFEELNGVDFAKGCYMGQEVTARTKYRGLVKKRLLPVAIEGEAPPPGTPLMAGDREAGEMRSSSGDRGVALVRLEFVGQTFTAGGSRVTPRKPDWAKF